jgi:hypothetical protein
VKPAVATADNFRFKARRAPENRKIILGQKINVTRYASHTNHSFTIDRKSFKTIFSVVFTILMLAEKINRMGL